MSKRSKTLVALRGSLTRKRVFMPMLLSQTHQAAWSAFTHEDICLKNPSRFRSEHRLTEVLLGEIHDIRFEPLPSYQDESLRNVRLPHYRGDLVIGYRTATKFSLVDNRSSLTTKRHCPIGFSDVHSTVILPDETPPVYFFGIRRTPEELRNMIQASDLMRGKLDDDRRVHARTRERLERDAREGGYHQATASYLPPGWEEDGALQITNKVFVGGNYLLRPLVEMTRVLESPKDHP